MLSKINMHSDNYFLLNSGSTVSVCNSDAYKFIRSHVPVRGSSSQPPMITSTLGFSLKTKFQFYCHNLLFNYHPNLPNTLSLVPLLHLYDAKMILTSTTLHMTIPQYNYTVILGYMYRNEYYVHLSTLLSIMKEFINIPNTRKYT